MKRLFCKLIAAAGVVCLFAMHAQASVVITGTRVVYPAQEREVSVRLTNNGKLPALVQVWIDNGDPKEPPEKIEVPFTLTPAMSRLDPGKGQTLRLIYTKEPLAQDRETLFWLNVLDVPPKVNAQEGANLLQIAVRSRIKLLFRPQGLPGAAIDAPAKLAWEVVRDGEKGYALKASNPTPYVVSLGAVELRSGGKVSDAGAGLIRPGESELFPLKGVVSTPNPDAEVAYTSINDWGGIVKGSQALR
jgi:chaperone protein EcpD